MPNSIGVTGITVADQAELVALFTAAMQTIYGADINLSQSSPDGEEMMLYIQMALDLEDLLVQVNNMFDPDNAVGVILDQRVAINGIQRQEGTFTITNATLIATQALNLVGLDDAVDDESLAYTIADNAGNRWLLRNSQSILGPGTYVYSFRAQNPGAVLTVPNTITVPITIVLGIASINNPSTYTSLGVNEESDAALKVRRQKSVGLAGQGYYAGLYAALLNIPGVTFANIVENDSGGTDSNVVPGHSIWVIVAGTGAASAIANAIYTYRNAGCGMYGSISLVITQVDGTPFVVYWDDVTTETVYIRFTANSLDGVTPPNIEAIRTGLVTSFVPGVAEQLNINDLATQVQIIDPNTLVTDAGFSLAATGPFTDTLSPSGKNKQFVVIAANIIILPMILSPVIVSVASGDTQEFTGLGGFGVLTYSMDSNPSGGTVDSVTGVYTAGTEGFMDVVKVTDSQGHTATATVTVTP